MNIAERITDKPLISQSIFNSEESGQWFDDIVATIRTHQLLLETNNADEEKKSFYETLISGSFEDIVGLSHRKSTQLFIKLMTLDYIFEIKNRKLDLIDLAVDNSNSGLLVWAVIKDDDENTEDQLLLSAAKINAKYNHYGFSINTTILEESDEHPIPVHYQSVINY